MRVCVCVCQGCPPIDSTRSGCSVFCLNGHLYKVVFSVTQINPCPGVNGKVSVRGNQVAASKSLSAAEITRRRAPSYPPADSASSQQLCIYWQMCLLKELLIIHHIKSPE